MPRLIGPDFIGIQVADLEAARTFYTQVVGLTAAPNGPPGAVVFNTKPIPFAVRTPVVDLDGRRHARPWYRHLVRLRRRRRLARPHRLTRRADCLPAERRAVRALFRLPGSVWLHDHRAYLARDGLSRGVLDGCRIGGTRPRRTRWRLCTARARQAYGGEVSQEGRLDRLLLPARRHGGRRDGAGVHDNRAGDVRCALPGRASDGLQSVSRRCGLPDGRQACSDQTASE